MGSMTETRAAPAAYGAGQDLMIPDERRSTKMVASTYELVSKSVRSVMTAVGLVPAAAPVPGLAGWRRAAVAR
jgi:hypothetical protein